MKNSSDDSLNEEFIKVIIALSARCDQKRLIK